jgi:hypothetical protein
MCITVLKILFSAYLQWKETTDKNGKPFSDYELICEIQIKNGLDLGENYRNINGCKTFVYSTKILNNLLVYKWSMDQ